MTVAICTWNRHELLRQTLEEMTHLEMPGDVSWELLIVNNNCTDATDVVIAAYAERLPIRRLFQPIPGLSNARNLASLEATGEYVIWTDDDVLVAPDWLRAYIDAFESHPEAALFGGPIRPWFPNTPPRWLEDSWPWVANAYAAVDYGSEKLPLAFERVPFGANMAIRIDAVRLYPYRPELGVRPGSRMGGEETDVFRRALREGHTGWWIPKAAVRHYIPVGRQSRRYLRDWFDAYGQYLGLYDERKIVPRYYVLGRPRWLWRELIVHETRYQLNRHITSPKVWARDLIAASVARGQFRTYREKTG
ncbi:MAG: glycosyltransferase [Gemmatimonadaceae bacterium]